MSHSINVHDLGTLIRSHHSLIVIDSSDESRVVGLICSAALRAKMPVYEWSIIDGLSSRNLLSLEKAAESPIELLKKLRGSTEEAVYILKDFGPNLQDPVIVRQLREVVQNFARSRSTVILTGTTQIPTELTDLATHFQMSFLSREELDTHVRSLCEEITRIHKIKFSLDRDQYGQLLNALSGMTLSQVRSTLSYVMLHDGKLDEKDIQLILEKKANFLRNSGIIEYYPVHTQTVELGGFKNLKRWMDKARVGFSDEAKKYNLSPPKGILVTGIQGCGKSLTAKFISKAWSLPLLKLDAGRLFDKFIGETEKNFHRATATAEAMAPSVLWIDEIEKGITLEDGAGGDAGLSRRIFGSFLTWLQEKRKPVFVVATANDLFRLPPELLRKGRFDEIFFVDLPDLDERQNILEIHLRIRNVDPRTFPLSEISAASDGFSGAELEQAVTASLYAAIYLGKSLTPDILLNTLRNSVPLSVTRKEDIVKLRAQAKGRFIPVS